MISIHASERFCSAFLPKGIGSRVLDEAALIGGIKTAITEKNDPDAVFFPLPEELYETVSCGIGPRIQDPEAYVVRGHRERAAALFLKREYACKVASLAVVVYGIDKFSQDPQVTAADLATVPMGTTHVIVAVLAGNGEEGPVGPWRFAVNVAGGNKKYLEMSADEIRAEAGTISNYWARYCTVAD